MKRCGTCKAEKDDDQFYKRAASPDGLSNKCKECQRAYDAAYHKAHAKEAVERVNAWRQANPEATLAQRAKYRDKHRDEIARKNRESYAENIETERARSAEYHARNPERALERNRKWVAEKPEAARAKALRRRAKVAKAEGTHSGEDIRALFELQRGRCAICKAPLKDGYHVDHIVPIARGGSNWPSNLQLACGSCNRQKSAKAPERFMQERGFLL